VRNRVVYQVVNQVQFLRVSLRQTQRILLPSHRRFLQVYLAVNPVYNQVRDLPCNRRPSQHANLLFSQALFLLHSRVQDRLPSLQLSLAHDLLINQLVNHRFNRQVNLLLSQRCSPVLSRARDQALSHRLNLLVSLHPNRALFQHVSQALSRLLSHLLNLQHSQLSNHRVNLLHSLVVSHLGSHQANLLLSPLLFLQQVFQLVVQVLVPPSTQQLHILLE